jgi:hypothetical protein
VWKQDREAALAGAGSRQINGAVKVGGGRVETLEAARTHAIETLYLQTAHLGGGLYSRLGWRRLQEHHEGGVDQVVMVKDLALKDRERGGITGR